MTFKSGILTSEKKDQVARIGVRGGGLGDSGNAWKETFFFYWCLSLRESFVISFRFNVHNLRARINIRDRFRQKTDCAHDHNNMGHKSRPTEQKTVWCLHLCESLKMKAAVLLLVLCTFPPSNALPRRSDHVIWWSRTAGFLLFYREKKTLFSFSSIRNIL